MFSYMQELAEKHEIKVLKTETCAHFRGYRSEMQENFLGCLFLCFSFLLCFKVQVQKLNHLPSNWHYIHENEFCFQLEFHVLMLFLGSSS